MKHIENIDILFVNVILTTRCSAQCDYCAYWRTSPTDIDLSVFQSLVYHASKKKIKAFFLTGGEPLAHPQFGELLKILRDYSMRVILCTNGWKLDKLTYDDLSGIRALAVSLDTWDASNYVAIRGRPMHEHIVQHIKCVRELSPKLPITITCLIQPKNILYLKNLHEFGKSIGASALSLLVPSYEEFGFGWESCGTGPKVDILSYDEIKMLEDSFNYLEKLEAWEERFLNQTSEVLAEYVQYFRMWAKLPFRLPKRICFSPHSTITVTERGTLIPCFYLPHEFTWNHNDSPFDSEDIYNFRCNFNFKREFK